MNEIEKLDSALLHVNHACILIKRQDEYLLCDPWFISPAFNNWTQNPPPPAALIRYILGIDKRKLSVVTSHGHDDHIDDYFVAHHLKDCKFYTPTFRSPGLQKRIEGLTGRAPTMLTDEPGTFSKFTLSRTVNDEFTGFDSIINIETDAFTVIHANDNWHRQSEPAIKDLLALKSRSHGAFYYLSQLGIADCFPQCYPQFSYAELQTMARSRIAGFAEALAANMAALDIPVLYSYANQSRIVSEFAKQPFNGFEVVTEMIEDHNRAGKGRIIQLMPGDFMDLSRGFEAPRRVALTDEDLLALCIRKLEEKANVYIGNVDKPGPVLFRITDGFDSDAFFDRGVVYATNRITWQRIMTGLINLETITIGGGGIVLRNPKEFNIRDVHQGIGNFAYVAQSNFNKFGLDWLIND